METTHLTKFTKEVNNIQALSDKPNTADGLTAQELKKRFDQAGIDIKSFINDTLISEIEKLFGQTVSTTEVNNLLTGYVKTQDLSSYVKTNDARLTNSRKCNNTFDAYATARNNLLIKYGNTLPAKVENGCIFFEY